MCHVQLQLLSVSELLPFDFVFVLIFSSPEAKAPR